MLRLLTGMDGLEGAVGVGHVAHLQHAVAVGVALQQQAVVGAYARQGHQRGGAQVQAPEALIRGGAHTGRAPCRPPLSEEPLL